MNIIDVGKELRSDEKVLESAFKLETLYKKHKFKLWIIIILSILYFGTIFIKDTIHKASLAKGNQAFLILQKNPIQKSTLKILKSNNIALYKLFIYKQAVKNDDIKTIKRLSNSNNNILSDISKYTVGILDKKPVDSKLYRDMALLDEAYISIKKGNTKNAKEKLNLIDEQSSLVVISKFLKHSLIKEN